MDTDTLAVIGSVCSIISFIVLVISMFTSKDTIKRKILWFILLIVMAISIGGTVYLNSELKRIKDIHNKAERVYRDYDGSFYNEYIHEVLTFLEENQDRYPDAYERAKHINEEMEESDSSIEERIAAEKMHGIVKGVVEMNKK